MSTSITKQTALALVTKTSEANVDGMIGISGGRVDLDTATRMLGKADSFRIVRLFGQDAVELKRTGLGVQALYLRPGVAGEVAIETIQQRMGGLMDDRPF